MAEYRTVHSKMWRDSWYSELDIDGKLLWCYLITNQAASLTGIYHLPIKFAAFETGLSQERVTTLLAQFVISGKIEYENSVVWVRRMRKYQAANESSPKIKPRIKKDLEEIPDCKIKRLYLAQYHMDTILIPSCTDQDQDTDTDTETDQDIVGANDAPKPPAESTKPKRSRKEPDERTSTAAIQACRQTAKRYPPVELYDKLIGALGNAPDIETLAACRAQWLERGYNPGAWTWATEWYVTGIPSRNGNGNGKDHHAVSRRNTEDDAATRECAERVNAARKASGL